MASSKLVWRPEWDKGIFTTTPAGRFLFYVIAAMDKMIADLIGEGTGRPRGTCWPRSPLASRH
ncbi:hypothetical protein [Nocardia sp. NPDC051981]|uniref:hypothetical protein n=1 Tax=Nocardia sp. NPDC051981 TaxID=3155417 RepID=UPI0034143EAF